VRIPIIEPLKRSLKSNSIKKMVGIINGTTNFILSKMTNEKADYKKTLKLAQSLGYAEFDPTADVEGHDAADKISILSELAFGGKIKRNEIHSEGISKINLKDIEYANKLGFEIKLLALSERGKINSNDSLALNIWVGPSLIPKSHPLSTVKGVNNALLIENSSAFRLDRNVPLIVPEDNASEALNHNGVIANPNCTTILLTLVLAPLNKLSTIQRVVVSTYQSVSGAGQLAMEELKLLTEQYLQGNPQKSEVLPYSLAFNLFLHNSPMLSNNYCEEEMKMVNETRKILNITDLKLSATCVRVPVLRAHSESINIEFADVVDPKDALEELKKSPGIEVIEDYINNRFPMPNDVM